MVKIQLELDEEEDRIVDIFRAVNSLKNKRKAIKAIIRKYDRLTKK